MNPSWQRRPCWELSLWNLALVGKEPPGHFQRLPNQDTAVGPVLDSQGPGVWLQHCEAQKMVLFTVPPGKLPTNKATPNS